MPHPPSPRELQDLDFVEDQDAAAFMCCNCGRTRGDMIAQPHNGDFRTVCYYCHVLLQLLKEAKSLHPDDPLTMSATTRLQEIHADIQGALNRRQHERALGLFDAEDDDGQSEGWVFERPIWAA